MTKGQELSEELFDKVSDVRDFFKSNFTKLNFTLGGVFKTIQEVEIYIKELEEENEELTNLIDENLLIEDDLDYYEDRF